ncbi:MAG: hypothetical protein ACE5GO_00600 [Anaerolineales bacterium]
MHPFFSVTQRLLFLLATKITEVDEKIHQLNQLKAELEIYHQALAEQLSAPLDTSQPTDSPFCTCLENEA